MEINEEKRSQWQALKGMGFKAYWDYFWDYYKIHVIVGVLLIIFAVSLIRDVAGNKPFALNAVFINGASLDDESVLAEEFAEYEGIDTNEEQVFIDTSLVMSEDNVTASSNTISSTQKLYAMIAAKELDVILSDPDTFGKLSPNEMYLDLREYFTEDELDALGDRICYVDQAEIDAAKEEEIDYTAEDPAEALAVSFERRDPSEMEQPIPVGIILDNSSVLSESGFYKKNAPIAGISVTTERGSVAADFIRYLLR